MRQFTRLSFLVLGAIGAAFGDTLYFTCVTDNSTLCPGTPSGLSVAVTDAGSGTVDFTFTNNLSQGTITDIYIDEGTLQSFFSSFTINNGTGVLYTQPATGQFGAGVNFTTDFSFEPLPPPTGNGINVGESLTVTGTLLSGVTFADLNLATGPTDTANLRIGIHVQQLANGQSDKLVSTPTEPDEPPPGVPEPSTYVMLGSALAGLGLYRRHQARK